MCGRFTLTLPDFEALAELVGATASPRLAARYRRRWNIAPSDAHWIVVPSGDVSASAGTASVEQASQGTASSGPTRSLVPASWGFTDRKLPLLRAEAAGKQAMSRAAFGGQRCLVPADGFYEWTGEKGERVPYWFRSAHGTPLLFGALYEDTADGARFAILTTSANATVAKVHDRMPLIISRDDIDTWLRGNPASLIHPAPDDLLLTSEVGTRVNAVRNDDPACIEPPSPHEPKQGKLF